MKYFAYGMNTNKISMLQRCPKAQSLGAAVLENYQFNFKNHATIEPNFADSTEGVLWEITDECERALDKLEGYPSYYYKIIVMVEHQGELVPAMTYIMPPSWPLEYPNKYYVDMLDEGYEQHGIELDQIDMALERVDQHLVTKKTQTSVYADMTRSFDRVSEY